jgi:predicted nucleotidyltransferase
MTPLQKTVSDRWLAEQVRLRETVVVALSGAHAYGFPSPDSDLDLKAIHIDPTRRLLGLRPTSTPIERIEIVEGVELDYSSHELGMVLAGVLKGNGNFIERILGHLLVVTSPALAELRPLVQASLSQRVHRHYRGFAHNQRLEAEKTHRAKKVLYVLRTTLTGAHLLRTGQLVTDLTDLAPVYDFDVTELLAAKSHAEKQALTNAAYTRACVEMDRAFVTLDTAVAAATVPPAPPVDAESALEDWLVGQRAARV